MTKISHQNFQVYMLHLGDKGQKLTEKNSSDKYFVNLEE
jgi:hypothetical protein